MPAIQWDKELQPLLKKYKRKSHPLVYKNMYQLIVMVVLSAQTSDNIINQLSPELFKAFPTMKSLAKADAESLIPYVHKIRNFANKTKWLLAISKQLQDEKNIPFTLDELTKLPGIGRKSANVIMREAGMPAEGVAVDLHVARVAPRLGLAKGNDPRKIEQQIMKKVSQKHWGEAGMAISFLGREICRPTNPLCKQCVMNGVCAYYKKIK